MGVSSAGARAEMRRSVLLVACLVAGCDAHGFITKPTSRNTLVCDDKWSDYLKHYNNKNFWCKTDRESHCPHMPGKEKDCQGNSTGKYPGAGVPKEPYCSAGHDSRFKSGDLDGLNKPGPVQATYTAGETVEMTWRVAADHGGKYQYRLCLDGSDTEDCFKEHQLKNDKGDTWIKKISKTEITDKIKIPDGISCDRCTLSFRWDGLWESVIFASCADIKILKKGTPPSPPGPAPPPASFEKHDNAYCGTDGTDAERVADKSNVKHADCENLCAADSKCSCYDDNKKDQCRLYHGHPKVVSSSAGFQAYTREGVPPSPPGPSPSSASFTKHDNAYCGTDGTDAERVADKSSVKHADCEKLCAADSECSCYDDNKKDQCRLYHGHPKVVSSSAGFQAYTRD